MVIPIISHFAKNLGKAQASFLLQIPSLSTSYKMQGIQFWNPITTKKAASCLEIYKWLLFANIFIFQQFLVILFQMRPSQLHPSSVQQIYVKIMANQLKSIPSILIKELYLSLVYLFLIMTQPPLAEDTLKAFPTLLPTITLSQSQLTIEQKFFSLSEGIRSHKISSLTKRISCFLQIQTILSIYCLLHILPVLLFGLTKIKTFAYFAFFSNFSKSIQNLVSNPFFSVYNSTSTGILPRTLMILSQWMQHGAKTNIPSPLYEKQLTATFVIVKREQEVNISQSLIPFCGSFMNLLEYHFLMALQQSAEGILVCQIIHVFNFLKEFIPKWLMDWNIHISNTQNILCIMLLPLLGIYLTNEIRHSSENIQIYYFINLIFSVAAWPVSSQNKFIDSQLIIWPQKININANIPFI